MKIANSEQKPAIEHEGGVLLSAGAGSGKTFVLIEHIVYLAKSFLINNHFSTLDDCEKKIKRYFSQIVCMTFTKKATAEISIRLKNRFREEWEKSKKNDSPLDPDRAKILLKAFENLFIGTIHGFCSRLLRSGYFPEVNMNQEIIGEVEFQDKIERLIDQWLNIQENKNNSKIKKIFLLNRYDICRSFLSVFNSSEIRRKWKKSNIKKINLDNEKQLIDKIFTLMGLDDLEKNRPDFDNFESPKRPAWSEKGAELFDDIKNKKISSYEELLDICDYLNSKKLPPCRSTVPPDVRSFIKQIEELKNFLKKHELSIKTFSGNKKSSFSDWMHLIYDLYCFIEKHYHSIPGLTYSDLEYFVEAGLESREIQEKISSHYRYFIVDELQDTSGIQYEILKKIVNEDFSRLFCVGDIKQAIYGFRGGEISIFQKCLESFPKNLKLQFNYRSCENIIRFNNLLFKYLFLKKEVSEGKAKGALPFENQLCPEKKDDPGAVEKYNINFEVKSRNNKALLEQLEAEGIVRIVKKKLSQGNSDICILYKKLTPIKFLLPAFLRESISFSSQIKIDRKEDPLIFLFKDLISPLAQIENKDTSKKNIQLIKMSLEILGKKVEEFNRSFDSFYKNVPTLGLWESFKKILFDLKIYNSNYENNLNLIRSLCLIGKDDPVQVLERIKFIENVEYPSRYSLELRIGNESNKVRIMTVHASKGLEFSHVILGGIHTNGGGREKPSHFGSCPKSLKWKIDLEDPQFYCSPEFIYEKLIENQRDSAESKRLFYVACTRAQKTLSWCDISLKGKPEQYSSLSWIERIRSWEKEGKGIIQEKNFEENWPNDNQGDFEQNDHLPFFHKDNLGIQLGDRKSAIEMMISPELSVKNLSLLTQCPRKFYFKYVLKLDWPKEVFKGQIKGENSAHEKSSLERGELIHEKISLALKNGFQKTDNEEINWVLDQISLRQETHRIVSEELIKFPLFNFMISGIPDLVAIAKEDHEQSEIWDFKTGSGNSLFKPGYWIQLMAYAYAFYQSKKVNPNKKVQLLLCFVNLKSIEKKELSFNEISDFLYQEWRKINSFHEINQDFCSFCLYETLCHDKG